MLGVACIGLQQGQIYDIVTIVNQSIDKSLYFV